VVYSGGRNKIYEKYAIGISVIALIVSIIAAVLAVSIPLLGDQPHISITPYGIYNKSVNSNIAEISIYNTNNNQNLLDFYGESLEYFNMSYYNGTDKKSYYLYIPIKNYYNSPIYSVNGTGFIASFTISNFNESNIDQMNGIEQNFLTFAKNKGDEGKLTSLRYVHLKYIGNILSHEDYYFIGESIIPINSNDLPHDRISTNPVDLLAGNTNDMLFENWIEESYHYDKISSSNWLY
jgi:hypothetical protein